MESGGARTGRVDPLGAIEAPARPTPAWRNLSWLAVVTAIVLGLAGGFWLFDVQPFDEGSTSGAGSDRGFVRSEPDPFGGGSLYVYCDAPGELVAWYVSITNTAQIPVTLLGAVHSETASIATETNGVWLESIAAARRPPALMPPRAEGPTTDPFEEPDLRPTTIQPGQEYELWAR